MADYEPRGITVRDVAAADFIKAYAEHLKNTGRVELPSWCDLVKTAPHKEMCPYDQDWYYIRAGESGWRRKEVVFGFAHDWGKVGDGLPARVRGELESRAQQQ